MVLGKDGMVTDKKTEEGQVCPKRLLYKTLSRVSCVSCFEEGAEPLVVDFH